MECNNGLMFIIAAGVAAFVLTNIGSYVRRVSASRAKALLDASRPPLSTLPPLKGTHKMDKALDLYRQIGGNYVEFMARAPQIPLTPLGAKTYFSNIGGLASLHRINANPNQLELPFTDS